MQTSCVSFISCIFSVKTAERVHLCPLAVPPLSPLPSFPTTLLFPRAGFQSASPGSRPCGLGPRSPQSSEGLTPFHAAPWVVPWQRFETFLFK